MKKRGSLLLMVRETPLHLGHLRTLSALTEMGAVISPAVHAFYAHPQDLADMVNHTIGRALDHTGLDAGTIQRWKAKERATETVRRRRTGLVAA